MIITKMKYLVILTLGLFLFISCQNGNPRKIRLSTNKKNNQDNTLVSSSVLRVMPESQRSVAILLFKNDTKDRALDWLKRGLTDMLTTDLKQSPYINLISFNRLLEVAEQLGEDQTNWDDLAKIEKVSRNANTDLVISGKYYRDKNNLVIEVELIDIKSATVIPIEPVTGTSLERIFAMVDELSQKVRENLKADIRRKSDKNITLANMTNSVDAFRFYSKAMENMEKLLYFDALKSLEEAVKIDSTFALAYLRLASMNSEGFSRSEALVALKKAEKYSGKLSERDRLRLEITKVRYAGRYSDLQNILEEAVRTMPMDIDFRTELARYYMHYLGDLDRALSEFEIILELDPNQKLVYNDLGYIFAWRGDYQTAFKYFEKYRELAPDEPNPYDSMGEVLMQAGRFDEAIQQLKIALRKWPSFYHSALRLSEINCELGDFQNSLKYLDQVISLAPSPDVVRGLELQKVALFWRFNKFSQADKLLESLLKKSPSNSNLLKIAAEFYDSMGDTVKSRRIIANGFESLAQQVRKYPKDNQVWESFLSYTISAPDLDPQKAVTTVENLSSLIVPREVQTLKKIAEVVLYRRVGDNGSAREIITNSSNEFVDMLVRRSDLGWGSVWKYVLETIVPGNDNQENYINFYNRMIETAGESNVKNFRNLAAFTHCYYSQLNNDNAGMIKEYLNQGAPLENLWYVLGPFSQKNVSGFFYPYPPEQKINLNAKYAGLQTEINWQPATDRIRDGYLDLRSTCKQSNWAVAYALIYAYSPDERKAQIRLGTDEACKLWLNDEQIWQHYLKQTAQIDRDIVTVILHPGYNKFLVKVTNSIQEWGFYFRITDEKGNGYPDITFHPAPEALNSLAQK
ncbi:MAG: tetratricopeptide repeat protein [Calditrichota bacterium]